MSKRRKRMEARAKRLERRAVRDLLGRAWQVHPSIATELADLRIGAPRLWAEMVRAAWLPDGRSGTRRRAAATSPSGTAANRLLVMRSRTCCSPTLQDTDGERGCASVASDPRVATFTFSVPQGLLPDLGFGVRVPRRLRVRVLRWPFERVVTAHNQVVHTDAYARVTRALAMH